jgi:C_GCAxxG_C_C family probable redox protein
MPTVEGRIYDLKIKGYCCSQLVASIAGLEPLETENDELLRSLRGLCFGMFATKTCGALTGGVCALSLHLDRSELTDACRELTEWFDERFGSTECGDLINSDVMPSAGMNLSVCMEIVKETSEKCLEMLMEMDLL